MVRTIQLPWWRANYTHLHKNAAWIKILQWSSSSSPTTFSANRSVESEWPLIKSKKQSHLMRRKSLLKKDHPVKLAITDVKSLPNDSATLILTANNVL